MEGQNGTSEELFSLIETGTYQIKSKLKGQPIKEEILPITSFHKSIENESTENKENEEEKKIAKFSRYRPEEAFEAEIHQVDFHKLMKKPEDKPTPELQEIESRLSELKFDEDEKSHEFPQAVKGINNEDLLLGCAAVYMSSLGEVDDETALESLTSEHSKTLLVALTIKSAKQHAFARLKRYDNIGRSRKSSSSSSASEDYLTEDEEEVEEDDGEEEEEENVFSGVFSDYDCSSCDEEDSEDDEEESSDVELLTNMIEEFVCNCKDRKDRLEKWYKDKKSKKLKPEDIPDDLIGVEQRLVASMTYELSSENNEKSPDRIAVISLLATRRWYQGMGLANKIVNLLGESRVSGALDVIVVNVDEGALGFYQRQGFTADVLINLPYSTIHNGWYNTTRMIKFCSDKVTLEQLKCQESRPLKPCDLYDMKVEMNKLKEDNPIVHEKLSKYTKRLNDELLSLNTMMRMRDNKISDLKHQVSVSADMITEAKREMQVYKEKLASMENGGVRTKFGRMSKRISGKGVRKREEMAKKLKKIFNDIKPLNIQMKNISPYTLVPENITIVPEEIIPSEAQPKKTSSIMSAEDFIKKLISNDMSRSYIKSLLDDKQQACESVVDEETAKFLKMTIIKPLDDELPPPLDDFYKHDESEQESPANIRI